MSNQGERVKVFNDRQGLYCGVQCTRRPCEARPRPAPSGVSRDSRLVGPRSEAAKTARTAPRTAHSATRCRDAIVVAATTCVESPTVGRVWIGGRPAVKREAYGTNHEDDKMRLKQSGVACGCGKRPPAQSLC